MWDCAKYGQRPNRAAENTDVLRDRLIDCGPSASCIEVSGLALLI
jgi:hypothetical protein